MKFADLAWENNGLPSFIGFFYHAGDFSTLQFWVRKEWRNHVCVYILKTWSTCVFVTTKHATVFTRLKLCNYDIYRLNWQVKYKNFTVKKYKE